MSEEQKPEMTLKEYQDMQAEFTRATQDVLRKYVGKKLSVASVIGSLQCAIMDTYIWHLNNVKMQQGQTMMNVPRNENGVPGTPLSSKKKEKTAALEPAGEEIATQDGVQDKPLPDGEEKDGN